MPREASLRRHGAAEVFVVGAVGSLFTSLERWKMWPMSLTSSPSSSNHTRPRTTKKSTKSSLKVQAALKVEQSIVSENSNSN